MKKFFPLILISILICYGMISSYSKKIERMKANKIFFSE